MGVKIDGKPYDLFPDAIIIDRQSRVDCRCGIENYSFGLCRPCYGLTLRAKNPDFLERQRRNCRDWAHANPEKKKAIDKKWWDKLSPNRKSATKKGHRERWLKRKYGITQDDFVRILKKQSGRCALCRKVPKNTLHVDHDHSTDLVRGLLCFRCNYGLGWFHDDVKFIRRMAVYIERGGLRLKGTARRRR